MGQRLGPIASNVNWMAPHALAAQLIAQAGEATGQGYANFGRSIGAGIAQAGENKRRKFEFQTSMTERREARMADDARQNERLAMDRDVMSLKATEMQEAQAAEQYQLAAAMGDQGAMDAAMKRGENIAASKSALLTRLSQARQAQPAQATGGYG